MAASIVADKTSVKPTEATSTTANPDEPIEILDLIEHLPSEQAQQLISQNSSTEVEAEVENLDSTRDEAPNLQASKEPAAPAETINHAGQTNIPTDPDGEYLLS